jgi:hypothetical protein
MDASIVAKADTGYRTGERLSTSPEATPAPSRTALALIIETRVGSLRKRDEAVRRPYQVLIGDRALQLIGLQQWLSSSHSEAFPKSLLDDPLRGV